MRFTSWRTSASLRAASVAVLAKAVSLGVVLVAAPLMIATLGSAGYGCFVTIVSIAAFVELADLGVGNRLVTLIASAGGELAVVAGPIRRAFISATISAGLGIAALTAVTLATGWSWLIAPPAALEHAATAGTVTAGILLLANVPLSVSGKVLTGLGHTPLVARGYLAVSILQAAALGVAYEVHPTLATYLAAYFAPHIAVSLSLTTMAYRRLGLTRSWLTQRRSKTQARGGSDDWAFFNLAIVSLIAYGTDTLVIAHLLNQRAVTEYSLSYRMFILAPTFIALALQTLWPAYASAAARRDPDWIRHRFALTLRAAIGINACWGAILLAAAPFLQRVWVGHSTSSPLSLRLSLLAFVVVNGFSTPLTVMFNGLGVMRFQVRAAYAMAVLNVGLSLLLTRPLGVAGPIWGTVTAQTLCIIIPSLRRLRATFAAFDGEVGPGANCDAMVADTLVS